MKILMITCEWPSKRNPHAVPFLVQQVNCLRKEGVDIYTFRGNKNPIKYFWAWLSVQILIKLKKFDIVHAQFGQCSILALPKKIPLVVTFRGSDLEGIINIQGKYSYIGNLLRIISIFGSTKADKVIVVSSTLKKYIPDKKKHVYVIPSGINRDLFKPMDKNYCRKILGWEEGVNYVLFASSKSRLVKNYKLAEASIEIVKKQLDVKLIELSKIFHNNIPLFLNASDCLLLTSHHEGSPNIVKEAMACNVPIVSVNVGDVGERIGDIFGNYICKTREPEEIAYHLKNVLITSNVPNSRNYTIDCCEKIITQKIIDIYNELIHK